MLFFTTSNAVIVGLMQITVIVFGVLASGITRRMLVGVVSPATWLVNYGALLLALPLGWITLALWLRNRATVSDEIKTMAFGSGLFLLAGLILFVGWATLGPLVNAGSGLGDAQAGYQEQETHRMPAGSKSNTRRAAQAGADTPAAPDCVSELLILPDGRVLVHNLTPAFAALLGGLNPADEQIRRRCTLHPAPPTATSSADPDTEK